MKRAAYLRPAPLGLALLVGFILAPAARAVEQPLPEDAAGSELNVAQPVDYCAMLAASAWPRTPVARRALLHRFEILRPQCIGHAVYLAALGALWLEEGEPAQALLWLERSLLLNPDQPGAQADHALALAALGEPAARDALAQQWLNREDVPLALRQRLAQGASTVAKNGNGTTELSVSSPPLNTVDGWIFYREASWLIGGESNLDHSPRLNELTLTPPEGSISFPVESRPLSGSATVADLSWQLAYSPRTGMIVQTGLQGSARHAPTESDTDWHHIQWAGGASQQWGLWRGQILASVTKVGGALNEPYRLARLGVSIDREAIGCSLRVAVETEMRSHRLTESADGRTVGGLWNTQCPWPGSTTWNWGLALRRSVDEPSDPTRPGGKQRQASLGLRVFGPLSWRIRLDASLRTSLLTDSEGYSPLLENNAIRRLNQTQLSIELNRPLQLSWISGAEALVQLQAVHQSSNLPIFRYQGVSAYGGFRWRW